MLGRVERLPAVGHTIVLVFSSSLTGTARLFCSHPKRISIWLCVGIVKVRLGNHGGDQLVLARLMLLVITSAIIHLQQKVLNFVIFTVKLTYSEQTWLCSSACRTDCQAVRVIFYSFSSADSEPAAVDFHWMTINGSSGGPNLSS